MSDRASVYIPKPFRSPLHQYDTFYTDEARALNHRHRVYDAQHAIHLYEAGEYDSCSEVCHMVLNTTTSEAIRARCHGLLARVEREVEDRCDNARESVRIWEKVVLRTGHSKFPIKKAVAELIEVKRILARLEKEVEEVEKEVLIAVEDDEHHSIEL